MPQHFLSQAGVQLTDFTGTAGFSGSHDTTAKLVEAGTYQAGALNAAVWDDRVKTGKIDTGKVTEIFRTPDDVTWQRLPDRMVRYTCVGPPPRPASVVDACRKSPVGCGRRGSRVARS